jgi:PAS domain S-box-containing protein
MKKSERLGIDAYEQRKLDDQDNKQVEMYKTLIENLPCAVYSAFPGERGPTTFMSKNWKDWTGYSAEEFYQDPEAWPKCIYLDDRKKAVNAYIEACRNEAPYNLEYRIVHRDTGQVRYVRDQGLLSKDTKGTLIRVDGIITDITELKTSENELVKYRDHLEELVKERTAELEKANEVLKRQDNERKKAEEKLRQYDHIVSSSTDMLALLDKRFVYKAANSSYLKAFGKTPDKVIGHMVSEVFGKEFFETVIKPHAELCLAGEEVNYQAWFDFPACEPRYMDINYYPYIDSNNEVLGFVVNGRNITERKKAEEALQRERKLNEELFKTTPAFTVAIDAKVKTVMMNDAMCNALGYTFDEIDGADYLTTFIPERDRERLSKTFEILTMKRESAAIENYVLAKDGRELLVDWRGSQIFNSKGELEFFFGVGIDITERKKAEEKLLDYQAKLKSLASQLSLIEERERRRIAMKLHDQIGQSLVFSKLKLDELQHSANSSELTKALNEICNNIDQVIQDTRTLTFDLSSPILNEIGFETAVASWLDEQIQEKHSIKTEFEDDGQPKPLDDDIRAILFRNVRELLINVIKHANAQNVKVSVRKVDDLINISVEDNGEGFDPTEVASKATFGLFSIRERLEQLDGSFEIKSESGHGSKFTMTAPLKRV